MPTYVALLRAINLGARNRVAMADLRAALEGLGYDDVQTYLQSGNAIFRAPSGSASAVRAAVEKGLKDALGLDLVVLVRTPAQLAKVLEANPLGRTAVDHKRYQVVFADGPIPAAAVRDIDRESLLPEELAVIGSELYTWMPAGVQNSRLARVLTDKKLGRVTTARNWRTVQALHEMASGTSPRAG